MPPGSFAFRLSCYEQFGWTPQDVLALPETEAMLLSVYFEELAYHHAQERKKIEDQRSSGGSSGEDWHTDFVQADDDDDE